jgi:hypothetical protein
MRKIIGLLVGMALVFMVGSANATNNGTGDPLGLIASAAIQPFFSTGPDNTLIEVTSPLDDNFLHVIYFNAACNRLISLPKFVSHKGAIVFSPDIDLGPLGAPGNVNGLAAIARTANNVTLSPIPALASIHVRGYWFNLVQDFVRVVDTIAVDSAETGVAVPADKQTYSPLRSAASFVAPRDISPFFTTTLHLICPNLTVYAESGLFPPNFPSPPAVTTTIMGFLYDDDENFLLDFFLNCNCSTMFPLGSVSPLYAGLAKSFLSYTELVTQNPVGQLTPVCPSTNPVCNPSAFTGYRAISVGGGALDSFGRLANGAAYNYRNAGDHFLGIFDPNFTPGLR